MRSQYLLLATLLLTPALARAQAPQMNALRDQVTAMKDTAQLRQLEQQHVRGSSTEDQITAGFAALRLWEITENRNHARRSRRYFDSAAKLDPENAWAHYGHALSLEAEIRRGDGTIVTDDALSRALGYDPMSRGRRALQRAIALDPSLPGAADLLTKYAVGTRDLPALQQARAALEAALAEGQDSDDVLFGLVSATRELAEYERSADVAKMLVTRTATNAAMAHLELATSLASVRGRGDEAAEAYAAAVRLADGEMLEHLWEDAQILTRQREDFEWKRAKSDDDRRRMLETMWELRGALADMSGPERAAEHYRRMNVASQRFRRIGMHGAAPGNALRLDKVDVRYSDAGIIYIRHGEPDNVWNGTENDGEVSSSGETLASYMVWFYRRDNGQPMSFHFARFGNAGYAKDFLLVRTLPCPMPPEVAAMDRRLYPLTVGNCSMAETRSISHMTMRDAENALVTDTHRPALDSGIPFHYDWYTFRGENGSTDVVAAVGVPFDRLPAGGLPLRLSLAVVDSVNATVARTSQLAPAVPSGGEDALMRTYIRLTAPQSRTAAYRIGIRDQDNERVGMTYGGSVVVPNYSFNDMLMISDVVLAEPRLNGVFQRGEHRLALSPTQVFAGGVFRAYYEIYNLKVGTPYRTELQIRSANRSTMSAILGRDSGVKLAFEDVVAEGAEEMVRELREITAPFAPGEYILTVTVRAPGYRAQTKERRFTIE